MTVGRVEPVVDPDDDIEGAIVLDRHRHDHPFYAALEVAVELLRLQELAGAFQDDVAAEIAPSDVARRGAGAEAEVLAADRHAALAVDLERAVPAAMDAVEFQQVR